MAVIETGAVLFDLETKCFFSVNRSGSAIAQMLESGATGEEVNAQCLSWGAESVDTDAIGRFIDFLLDENLVVAANGNSLERNAILRGDWSPPTIEKHKETLQRLMTSAFDPTLPMVE
jgi:hypothetical protein